MFVRNLDLNKVYLKIKFIYFFLLCTFLRSRSQLSCANILLRYCHEYRSKDERKIIYWTCNQDMLGYCELIAIPNVIYRRHERTTYSEQCEHKYREAFQRMAVEHQHRRLPFRQARSCSLHSVISNDHIHLFVRISVYICALSAVDDLVLQTQTVQLPDVLSVYLFNMVGIKNNPVFLLFQ